MTHHVLNIQTNKTPMDILEMAGRIRTIKPEVLEDETAASLSDAAWRLWVSLWVVADDYGNVRMGDKYLAATVWQDTTRDVSHARAELIRVGMVTGYSVSGQRYGNVVGFTTHQRIDNAGKPRVPNISADDGSWTKDQQLTTNLADFSANNSDHSSGRGSTSDLRPPTSTTDPFATSGSAAARTLDLFGNPLPKPRKPRKPKAAPGEIPATSDHMAIKNAFMGAFKLAKGELPAWGPMEGKLANRLIDRVGAMRALTVISNAFANDWFVKNKPTMLYLVNNVNEYLGTPGQVAYTNPNALPVGRPPKKE